MGPAARGKLGGIAAAKAKAKGRAKATTVAAAKASAAHAVPAIGASASVTASAAEQQLVEYEPSSGIVAALTQNEQVQNWVASVLATLTATKKTRELLKWERVLASDRVVRGLCKIGKQW